MQRDAETYGSIATTLATALTEANDGAAAKEIYETLRFAPVGGEVRSQAFLALAKGALEGGDKIAALDMFVLTTVIKGADDAAVSAASVRREHSLKNLRTTKVWILKFAKSIVPTLAV